MEARTASGGSLLGPNSATICFLSKGSRVHARFAVSCHEPIVRNTWPRKRADLLWQCPAREQYSVVLAGRVQFIDPEHRRVEPRFHLREGLPIDSFVDLNRAQQRVRERSDQHINDVADRRSGPP